MGLVKVRDLHEIFGKDERRQDCLRTAQRLAAANAEIKISVTSLDGVEVIDSDDGGQAVIDAFRKYLLDTANTLDAEIRAAGVEPSADPLPEIKFQSRRVGA